jgi:hypothetical protein
MPETLFPLLYSETGTASPAKKLKFCSPDSGPRAGIFTRKLWLPQFISSNSLAPP